MWLHSQVHGGEFTDCLWKDTWEAGSSGSIWPGGQGAGGGDAQVAGRGMDNHSLLFCAVGIFKRVNGLLKQNVKVKKMKSGHCQHQTPQCVKQNDLQRKEAFDRLWAHLHCVSTVTGLPGLCLSRDATRAGALGISFSARVLSMLGVRVPLEPDFCQDTIREVMRLSFSLMCGLTRLCFMG